MTSSSQETNQPLSAAVFLVDAEWQIVALNKKAEELTGTYSAALVGKTSRSIFCSKSEFLTFSALCNAAEQGHIVSNHPILLCNYEKDIRKSVLVSVIPLPARNEKKGGSVICMQDASEESFLHQITLNSIADGVFTVDTNWEITSYNKAAEHITGWTADEVIGTPCGEIFHLSQLKKVCLLKDNIKAGKSVINRPIFLSNRNGDNIPVRISAAPLFSPDGKLIGAVQTFRDDSDSLKNDLILASVADGVFSIDQDKTITSFNHAAEKLTGWDAKEVIGKPCSDVFHSSVCGDACLLQTSIDHGSTYIDRSVFIKSKEGNSIPVSISSAPLLDDMGNIIGGIETFRDNTNSLRKHLILDSIADGVFTVDRDWKITSFNRAASQITGWDREEALGKSCSEVFHSSICGRNCAIAESLYSGSAVSNRSITILNHTGEKIPISISASPLTDHEGNIIGGVETFRDLTTIHSLRRQLNQKFTFDEIISKSASMQRLFKIMPEIARSPSTVLVLGESGTGKELVARALYNASERRDKPLVIVNCGALPETLLESELFGYKKGAFTDARKDKKGRFATAEGGTLFLDEIGDIPGSIQIKLLRVLQDKVYEPLGSNTPVQADVRIITATNRDLQALVREGRFREDLFYRLNVVKINLPPLRERMEDIPLLIEHFIKKYSAQQGKDIVGISGPALNILMHYDYPGNIRELENIIEYSFILCEGGYIQPGHLPEPFAPNTADTRPQPGAAGKAQTLEDVEKQTIELTLERNKWKKMVTCRDLGISKDTLRRKIIKYKLVNPLDKKLGN